MLQTCQIFFPNKAIAVVEQGMMQEEERHIAVSGVTLGGMKESQTPRRETNSPAQTESKCPNDQKALSPHREFILQGRIHTKGFMNWKAHWKERSRSVRCSARTLIFKDVPEGRRSPTAGKGPPHATCQHQHAAVLRHSQELLENF